MKFWNDIYVKNTTANPRRLEFKMFIYFFLHQLAAYSQSFFYYSLYIYYRKQTAIRQTDSFKSVRIENTLLLRE